jgi:methionine sulfoxide reductase heme-binding subunit
MMNAERIRWLRASVHPLSLLPLVILIFDGLAGRLSVNPIQDLTLRTGQAALILLLLSLSCTPLGRLTGQKWAVALRKPLGLYSFLYVCLHLLIFVGLDYGLDAELIRQAVSEKRYVLAGLASFLLLVPLAATSSRAAQRRLGRWWRRVHWLVYPAAVLAVLHFLWLSKVARTPLIAGAILLILLAARLPVVRRLSDRASARFRRGAGPARRPGRSPRSD